MDVLKVVRDNPKQFSIDFEDWLFENIHIWYAFEKEAQNIRARGREHYSSRTIVEFLRHHSAISEKGGMWKINDHSVPYLGRLFVLVHPEAKNFFEFRKINIKAKQLELF
jgi:hypothetical protein